MAKDTPDRELLDLGSLHSAVIDQKNGKLVLEFWERLPEGHEDPVSWRAETRYQVVLSGQFTEIAPEPQPESPHPDNTLPDETAEG